MILYLSIANGLMFLLCIVPELSLLSSQLNHEDLSLNVIV